MTKLYEVKFNKRFIKDLEKIPKKDQQHIRESISHLSIEPRSIDSKKLKGKQRPSLYRIRAGNYRIVYEIKDAILLILIIQVAHRKDVYR